MTSDLRAPRLAAVACVLVWVAMGAAGAEDADPDSQPAPADRFAVHGQATYVEQEDGAFTAPYSGPNSLTPDSGRETADVTLDLGARLWRNAELWLDEEIDQGYGLSNTLGVAGFPSGEAYKVGRNQPYLRTARAFIRQTIDLGDATQEAGDAANQFADSYSKDRWVFTVGKFGVPDIFDVNQYAHDPRGDFLNWSAIEAGSFDYAADAWGFTVGAAAEWYHGDWTVRGGIFDLSDVPNSTRLDPGMHEFQLDAELEHRHRIAGRPGKLMMTVFQSHGRMGLLDQALALAQQTGLPPNTASVRSWRTRTGISFNLEQELTRDLGLFARIGKAGGNVETYEFTDIDRAQELGLSLKGGRWSRPDDTVAIAGMNNAISGEREAYLNAGGLGILVGDGRLPQPSTERIVETYYSAAAYSQIVFVTVDFQRIFNPAYNTQRGPVSVVAVRVHAQL